MHFIYFHPSGSFGPEDQCPIWSMVALAVPAERWRPLQLRINSLQRSFLRRNYRPGRTQLHPSRHISPRSLPGHRTFGLLRGVQRITGQLNLPLFVVVVDKRRAHRPATSDWVVPLSLKYLERPIREYLQQNGAPGTVVLPNHLGHNSPFFADLVASSTNGAPPLIGVHHQTNQESAGLQVASLAARLTRSYHAEVAPRLHAGSDLDNRHKCLEDLYQGFVKANTWKPTTDDPTNQPTKGFVYLWRTPPPEETGMIREE